MPSKFNKKDMHGFLAEYVGQAHAERFKLEKGAVIAAEVYRVAHAWRQDNPDKVILTPEAKVTKTTAAEEKKRARDEDKVDETSRPTKTHKSGHEKDEADTSPGISKSPEDEVRCRTALLKVKHAANLDLIENAEGNDVDDYDMDSDEDEDAQTLIPDYSHIRIVFSDTMTPFLTTEAQVLVRDIINFERFIQEYNNSIDPHTFTKNGNKKRNTEVTKARNKHRIACKKLVAQLKTNKCNQGLKDEKAAGCLVAELFHIEGDPPLESKQLL
jgi:hypothetical protein